MPSQLVELQPAHAIAQPASDLKWRLVARSLTTGRWYRNSVPIVEVNYGPRISQDNLRQLAEALPHAVSVAVECPEEPYDHDLQPGDVEVRFRALGSFDISGMDLVVEVRSKWFESRARNRQQRCEQLRDLVADATGVPCVGVYLSLPVAAWSQSE